jgi:hypothetical protein
MRGWALLPLALIAVLIVTLPVAAAMATSTSPAATA